MCLQKRLSLTRVLPPVYTSSDINSNAAARHFHHLCAALLQLC